MMRALAVSLFLALFAGASGFGVVGVVQAASPPQPATPDAAVIRVESTTTVRVCADCTPRIVTFAVTPLFERFLRIDAATEKPKVTEVLAGGVRDAAMEAYFDAQWEVDKDKRPRTLIVTVKPELRTQGTYTVVLNVFPTARPKAPRVTLQIMIPTAKLLVPAKITIDRTVRWPLDVKTEPQSFTLRESGATSGIKRLQADPPELMLGTRSVTGQVRVTKLAPSAQPADQAAPAILPSDTQWRAMLALDGDFPLGISAGQLRLSAPELAEAVLVPIEIRSGLSQAFLFAAIVLGITLSWWLKVFTHGIIERNTSRAAAATLLRRVRADEARYPDVTFRAAIASELAALETARAGQSAAEMDSRRAALETKWRDALQDFVKRRTEFLQRAAELRELTTRTWTHPPALRQAVGVARTAFDAAVAVQETGDVTRASRDLDAARDTLNAAAIASGAWQRESRALLDALINELDPRFEAIRTALKANVDAWEAKIALFPQTPGKPDPTKLEEHLQRVDAEYREVTASLTQTVDQLRQALARAEARNASTPAWRAVRTQLDRIEQLLADAVDDPAPARSALATELQTFASLWAEAAKPPVRWRDERELSEEDTEGGGEILGDTDLLTAASVDPFRLAGAGPGRGDRGGWILFGTADDAYAADIAQSESNVGWAKFQQSVIVGLLFIVWAMTTYSPSFDGTWAGLATVFFSAFSVDVAVDSLLTKMKK